MGFYIPWLVDAARLAVAGTGKQVIAEPGWQNRGHGPMRVVEVVVGHHTGTPNTAAGDYPSLRIVRDGRADLAGPLAQYGLGRSGNVYVIAAGLCYHAGASAYGGFTDLNDEAIGIEAESAGAGGWTGDQLLIYPRLVAACLQYMRRGVDRYASHRTVARPAGRKPDPTGIADDWMRQRATPAQLSTMQEDDMSWGNATTQKQIDDMQVRLASMHAGQYLPWFEGAPGGDLTWFQVQANMALAPTNAMLAELVSAGKDDVTGSDVMERLSSRLDAELARLGKLHADQMSALRAQLDQARSKDREAVVDVIHQTLPADLAKQVVEALGARLQPQP